MSGPSLPSCVLCAALCLLVEVIYLGGGGKWNFVGESGLLVPLLMIAAFCPRGRSFGETGDHGAIRTMVRPLLPPRLASSAARP